MQVNIDAMPPQPFKALKVPSSATTPTAVFSTESNVPWITKSTTAKPDDISSPHELTAFVSVSVCQSQRRALSHT